MTYIKLKEYNFSNTPLYTFCTDREEHPNKILYGFLGSNLIKIKLDSTLTLELFHKDFHNFILELIGDD